MPRAPKRCSPSCPNPVVAKGKCADHQPARIPWENKRERAFLKSAEWDRQRRRILYRDNTDNGGCQLKFDGCTGKATTVDHIMPVWYTGREQVPDEELQGLCGNCHQIKSSFEGVQAKKIKKMREDGTV